METTVGIVTALNPILGYEKATELAQGGLLERQGHSRDHSGAAHSTEAQIKDLLDPAKLTGLDKSKYKLN